MSLVGWLLKKFDNGEKVFEISPKKISRANSSPILESKMNIGIIHCISLITGYILIYKRIRNLITKRIKFTNWFLTLPIYMIMRYSSSG